jgi:hypothetical protein
MRSRRYIIPNKIHKTISVGCEILHTNFNLQFFTARLYRPKRDVIVDKTNNLFMTKENDHLPEKDRDNDDDA